MPVKKCDNIFVRGVNWIGDAVMTLPALRALKRAEPGAKITLLVKPWVAPLFEHDPHVDEIILYSDEHKGLTGRLALANKLKKRHFCSAILLQNAFDAAFLSFAAGIPERIGYGRDGRRVLLTKTVSFDQHAKGLHHIDYYLNLLESSGFPIIHSMPWIYLLIEERIQARKSLCYLKRPVIALNPGAAFGSSKRWPPDCFADVAVRIINELEGSVVIIGGPAETAIAGEIIEGVNAQTSEAGSHRTETLINRAGRTSLRELIALISECDMLVTNDSGPMHIGYAVGTPVVAIFGSTSPEMTGPPWDGNVVIKKDVECSPCFKRECKKNDLQCMKSITSDDVFQAIERHIGKKRAVFFDRDGTLCKDAHYLNRMEDLQIFPGSGELKKLKDMGFALIGVSNQSGIARGIVDEEFVKQVNNIFIDRYGFDGFYYCPHHPNEHCSCRKPEPGLLIRARYDFQLNLKGCFVVGDKDLDMLLARTVGAVGIHVMTGQEDLAPHADFVARDLEEVVDIIEKNS